MKKLNILIIFLLIINIGYSQTISKVLSKFQDTNTQKVIDSLWEAQVKSKGYDCLSPDEKKYAKFIVIPVCNFKMSDFNYEGGSISKYLQIDKHTIRSFVIYNDSLIGLINIDRTRINNPKFDKANINTIIIPPLKTNDKDSAYMWNINKNYSILCSSDISSLKKFYSIFTKKPKQSFLLYGYDDMLWFYKNGTWYIYSKYDDKIFKETELIKGIKKMVYKKDKLLIGATNKLNSFKLFFE